MAIDRRRTSDTSYSDSVSVSGRGRWIHIAGQLAFDDERRVLDDDVAAQAHLCLDRIHTLIVDAGGSGLADVIAITVYLVRLEDYPDFDGVRAERFGETRPVSAAVQVAGLLFDAAIEVSAVAFVPEE